jgi:uncharacterized metal-binding protein YceD (DUF177 family)
LVRGSEEFEGAVFIPLSAPGPPPDSPRDPDLSGIMKLSVERLTPAPAKHSFAGSRNWWSKHAGSAGEIAEPVGDMRFELVGYVVGENVQLDGSADVELELECSRCAARYRQALHEEFRLVLEPAGEREPADPEGADALTRDGIYLGDDLGLGWYRGREIVIESYLAEVVALALPVQPVCRDDCAGLCPECG